MPGINLNPGLASGQVMQSLQQQGIKNPRAQIAYGQMYQADQERQQLMNQQRKRMGLAASTMLGFSLS